MALINIPLFSISVNVLTTDNVCGMMNKIQIGDNESYKYMMMRIIL